MANAARRTWAAAALLGLAVFAYSPLASTRATVADLTWVASLRSDQGGTAAAAEGPQAVSPNAPGARIQATAPAAWLGALAVRAGAAGASAPRAVQLLRLCNAAALALAALFLALALRRAVSPYLGEEAARAAAFAALALAILFPTQPATVLRAASFGDAIALATGCAACASFLRGRQTRVHAWVVAAALWTLVTGVLSERAAVLVPVLACAEFASARRWRPARVRWRTSATTAAVFAACAAAGPLMLRVLGGAGATGASTAWRSMSLAGGSRAAWTRASERCGVLLAPVLEPLCGRGGWVLAGLALLAALHPALLAARSAPRLWSRLALVALAGLLWSEAWALPERVVHADFTRADSLAWSAFVASAILAVCATALSGVRRALLPWWIALAFAVLARAHAGAWSRACEQVPLLSEELERQRETFGRDADILVLDPRHGALGVDALGRRFDALLRQAGQGRRPSARAVETAALLAFAREPEFAALRAGGLLVSYPRELSTPGAAGRAALLLPAPQPSGRVRSWVREGRSPGLDLETWSEGALVVRANGEGVDHAAPPVVHWRAASAVEPFREGQCGGVWRAQREDPDTVTAWFDLSDDLNWLFAGRVQQLFPSEGWGLIVEAQVEERVPPVAARFEPRVVGPDWRFEGVAEGFERGEGARLRWSAQLLDADTLELISLDVDVGPDVLVARGAQTATRVRLERGELVCWTVEGRVEGVALWRSRGRIEPSTSR